jgi:aspartate aminotransferase-like enzyme
MTALEPREFLMIPGPTPVPDAVLEAIGQAPIGHRTPEFSKTLKEVTETLQWLGQTSNDVFVLTGSGTSAVEAAVCNTINRGDRVLCLVGGVFGERWAKLSAAFGAEVERLVFEPGTAVDPKLLKEKLDADKEKSIKAVIIVHNETSTGVISDLKTIAEIIRAHGALSIVDAVTSFGATPLPIDEWQVDVVATGSQKALMLPPGLGFVFFGKRAWDAYAECKTPRFYLDLGKCRKSLAENTTPFTPNVSFVRGLAVSLEMIRSEGLDKVFDRHKRMRAMLRAGIEQLGLSLFVDEKAASPSITAILPPEGISVADIRKGLKTDFKILVADGQEALKGKIFRIGHMGYVFERDILMTLAALESVLTKLGHKCQPGAAVKAAAGVLSTVG